MRKIQARKGTMRIESHTTSLYQTILHRHPRIPAATLELTPRRCRSACKFLTRPFRKLQQAVRINPESLKLNAGQEIFAKHSQVAVGGVDCEIVDFRLYLLSGRSCRCKLWRASET